MLPNSVRTICFPFLLVMILSACSSQSNTDSDTAQPPDNAESSYSPSVRHGFNFEKDAQISVGFINYLKIADQELASDLTLTDPENVANTIKVFGVVSSIYWGGGYADPVQFSAQVTTDNKNVLATLIHKALSNTEIEFSFTIYDYDPKAKKYFQCFNTNAVKLKGLVLKSGGELAMAIDNNASGEVTSPKNYTFTLGVMPQDLDQQIFIAVSETGKFVKKWGVSISK